MTQSQPADPSPTGDEATGDEATDTAAAAADTENAETAAAAQARARALSSPIRLRIIRLCRFEARTNKELALLLGLNPGTVLHHVRTLVKTGFLAAGPERTGTQGAREVPYRSTGLAWQRPTAAVSHVLIETFLQQVRGLAPEDLHVAWLGLQLSDAHRAELEARLYALINEFRDRGPDPDGKPLSIFTAIHPDAEA
ncbi:winged helix-turn-helix domain-containing protein [Rarobacter incanus]|uniref:Helix-turn-helix protein n=1 Tax=Rarobacter incanus TaxID=153494 RepID=A0A542SQ56_9MICO|nr:winged helix-turn-helix domain-containing protein [Rarobacter incanus]TQK76750.1 helix-turn-helix protein [Rarobacter incanus]